MDSVVIQTDHRLCGADRFAWYEQQILAQPVPLELRIDRADGFVAKVAGRDLGGLIVTTLSSRSAVAYQADRTPAMIRRMDPEAYRLVVNLRGVNRSAHAGHEVLLRPGDMALYDTSVPFAVWRGGAEAGALRSDLWVMVTLPHSLLPLHPRSVRRLLGARLPGRTGLGRLTSDLVTRVAHDTALGRGNASSHLSAAIVDLLAAFLTHEVEKDTAAVPPESAQGELMLAVQRDIERRLGDPHLDPETVAAAHHISVRSLHRLFNAHGLTVAGWIRTRRLDRCRRDLADPGQLTVPIHTIAARWGFGSHEHFSRLFRTTYGMSPTDARLLARLTDETGPDRSL